MSDRVRAVLFCASLAMKAAPRGSFVILLLGAVQGAISPAMVWVTKLAVDQLSAGTGQQWAGQLLFLAVGYALLVAASSVTGGDKLALPQFWCNLAVGWRNFYGSREPLCDCFAWSFAVCGDFFEVAVWSFGIRSFRQHTLPSPSSVQRPTPHVLRAAASPAAGTAAIPGS